MATIQKQRSSVLDGLLSGISFPMLLVVAAMLIGLAGLVPLVQSSGATSTAGNIRTLEQQKTDAQARLRELELEIATLGSLNRIEQDATQRLKMTPPKETHYIRVDAQSPEGRRLPSRFLLPAAEPARDDSSSLWEDLFGWIPKP